MHIKQWEDENLAHFSYAVVSDCEKKIVLIDPSRNPQPYLDFAKQNEAAIIGIIETHPHADFVSSHLELSDVTGAPIYVNSLVGVSYQHTAFDEGDTIEFGKIKLTCLHTPGHSPDSITILLEYDGAQTAAFTGDTLFIGDCGRPDLREGAGNQKMTRLELAKSMYHTLRNKLLPLDDNVIVYPAHGAGSLCGKGLSKANSSTMAHEKETNWSLQAMTEQKFVTTLLRDQPFIPAYFPFDVELNRMGAAPYEVSIRSIKIGNDVRSKADADKLDPAVVVVDARKEGVYKQGHLQNSINLMEGDKFDTWLGSIIKPNEPFYLAGESRNQLQRLIERAAAIGFEPQIKQAFILTYKGETQEIIDLEDFKAHTANYTIVDVRNESELRESKPFSSSISIPLPEVRNRVNEIPTDKPIVVHCAAGYRSAAASSIIHSALNEKVKVYDLSEAVKQFLPQVMFAE